MEKKVQYIHIPNNLICTKEINHNAIYLYMILRMYSWDDKITNIHKYISKSKVLLERLNWKDRKTLKKYLKQLKEYGYITYDFDNIKSGQDIEIFFIKQKYGKKYNNYFVEIEKEGLLKVISIAKEIIIFEKDKITKKYIRKVIDLKEQAIRLFSYYCIKFKVHNDEEYNISAYAFPSYSTINKDIGIRDNNIKAINTNLHKGKILKVEIGDMFLNDDGRKVRERNHYIPLCKIKGK